MPKLIFINEYPDVWDFNYGQGHYMKPLKFIVGKRDHEVTLVCEVTGSGHWSPAKKSGFSDNEIIGGGEFKFVSDNTSDILSEIWIGGSSGKYGRVRNLREIVEALEADLISECQKFIPTIERVQILR